jgi:O-Antigen ligase
MNNNNTPAILRSLIIYAVCVPLAVWIGFMIANPFDRSAFSYAGILLLILCAPILLRWHHFLLIATWNLGLTIFFLPGSPPFWLLMTALSLFISVLHRTVNSKARFISAPSITLPLVFFLAVVAFTARLTGGIGLHSLGNDTAGGKNYVLLVMGILGYFALTAQPIPAKRAWLYVSLFFLAGCLAFISDLGPFLPSSLYFIFAFFPVSGYDLNTTPGVVEFHARYAGLGAMGMAGFFFMLARYGARGIFVSGRLWRPVLFGLFVVMMLAGGFRSNVILCGTVFLIQCWLERLHQTKVFPFFILAGLIAAVLVVPFANKLPFAIQRSLAILPLKLDPVARANAEGSEDWRLQIWKDALPTVPQYLLLGKGYALSQGELAMASSGNFHYASDIQSVDITGNYHSGPLSVVIYFGIWGVIAILWFWIAGLRALYLNYRYGDPGFRVINIFLLAYFVARIFLFLVVFGGIYGDMYYFTSIIGLSVSLNGGIRRPAMARVQTVNKTVAVPPSRPRFQPFYQS